MRTKMPRYVERVRSKGRDYYYFRRWGARHRLLGGPGEAEFTSAYLARLEASKIQPEPRAMAPGSIDALIRDYKTGEEFKALASKTQASYAKMLDVLAPIGHLAAEGVRRRHIRELRSKLPGKGRTQKYFTQVASILFNFGIDNDACTVNPAARMKRIGREVAYSPWTDTQCASFEASKPPGHLLTGYMIARYAGQRRGDVLRLTRTAYDGKSITVRQAKLDRWGSDEITIPVHSRLRAHLDELPLDRLLFIVDELGRPLREEMFSKQFRSALIAAQLPDLHFHGLRHTAGKALAEAGCTDAEIAAILGHRTRQMVTKYTRGAQQRRLAKAAIAKLERRR